MFSNLKLIDLNKKNIYNFQEIILKNQFLNKFNIQAWSIPLDK